MHSETILDPVSGRPAAVGRLRSADNRGLMSMESKLIMELDNSQDTNDFEGRLANDVFTLADVYIERGMLSGAELVLRHLLDNQERVLGIMHSAVGYSVDKLGALLRSTGRYVEADVIEIRHNFLQRKAFDHEIL